MGSKVDLTLQSIHGIVSDKDPRDVMAAVSFTGSASSMQVSSFTMCGHTGNLVIESNSLELDPDSSTGNDCDDARNSQPSNSKFLSFATFNDPMEGRRSLPSCAMSTDSNASSYRPHLQLKLSGPKPNAPKRSLATANKASAIQQNQSLSEDASVLSNDCSRGGSIHWEAECDAMPDIVELHVVLRNEDRSICQEGVAHLIFYGGNQREMGTTTMDLRIKNKRPLTPESTSNTPEDSSFSFAEDAFIRVVVDVSSSDRPAPSPEEIRLSDHFDEQKIGNIMFKLKEHEEMAAARAMNIKLGLQNQDEPPKNTPRRMFCNSGLDFGETFRTIIDAFTRCEGRRGKQSDTKSFMPILRTSSTMDSTIATRESLLI